MTFWIIITWKWLSATYLKAGCCGYNLSSWFNFFLFTIPQLNSLYFPVWMWTVTKEKMEQSVRKIVVCWVLLHKFQIKQYCTLENVWPPRHSFVFNSIIAGVSFFHLSSSKRDQSFSEYGLNHRLRTPNEGITHCYFRIF